MLLRLVQKLVKPSGSIRSNGQKLPVAIFRYECKSIVIIEKLGFVAVWQNLEYILKAVRKASFDILGRNIMSPAFHAISDSPNAFFSGIKTDIVQANLTHSHD